LGATNEIPNLDVWPKIALQNGRSVSFRGGLEPSDLGDSFGFPKYFSFRVSFGRVGMVEVVGMVGTVGLIRKVAIYTSPSQLI
jgi:hypothetical protein